VQVIIFVKEGNHPMDAEISQEGESVMGMKVRRIGI
jgi:hypothetical protein